MADNISGDFEIGLHDAGFARDQFRRGARTDLDRLIDDDMVEAVVDDPRGYTRA